MKQFPLLALSLLIIAMPAVAQSPPPSSGSAAASPLAASLAERSECLSRYRLGSVQFDFGTNAHEQSVLIGETLQVTGTLRNTNAYPLPEGRVIVRILRQEDRVKASHWHPVVAEQTLDGDYALAASGERPFTFRWPVPTGAPAGVYRAEFFYLMGSRYIFSGIPYVSNFPGGTALFSVRSGEDSQSLIQFDRASVQLNGKPLALRSVSPALSPGEPVTVTANLTATGSGNTPVTIRAVLYEWSDTDAEPPLQDTSSSQTLQGGSRTPVNLRWDAAKPGVYEVVFTATPEDTSLLPSMLRVRFPVTGNTPRIIFSGVTETSANTATVTTCVVNGTKGSGKGSVTTRVLTKGAVIHETTDDTGPALASSVVTVPVTHNPLEVYAEARDDAGNITDAHRVTYPAGTFAALPKAPSAPQSPETAGEGTRTARAVTLLALLVPLAALFVIIRRRRRPL